MIKVPGTTVSSVNFCVPIYFDVYENKEEQYIQQWTNKVPPETFSATR